MVKEIKCDIFDAPISVLAHFTNCQSGPWGGLAGEVKRRYPKAWKDDCQTKKGDRSKMGTCKVIQIGQDDATVDDNGLIEYICNLYTQFDISRDERMSDYEAIYRALEHLKATFRGTERVIGLPYLAGCGLGRANWNIVRVMIDEVFKDSGIEVLICKKD